MPHTPAYLQRLGELRHKAPKVAKLTARIAATIKPERQRLDVDELESVLFEYANAIAHQLPSCATRLTVWLNILASDELKALEHHDVATFVNEAATLGGPSGVLAG
jgi:hypothetical protein